jgi:hypothetical protein
MKSGEFNVEISETHFRAAIADILDYNFVQRTFHPRPALIATKPVSGHRMWKEFKGEPFDPNEFQKLDGYWDHEHCSICWFRIVDGHTYWENTDAVKILCDACYEEYKKRS